MDALVSLIVPVYNASQYLTSFFKMIQDQTYKNFEALLIDDGSSDKTLEQLKVASDRNPQVKYFHQENAGVSKARNRGISEAKGEFLIFVDIDDEFEPTYVEKLANAAKNRPVELVTCGYTEVTSQNIELFKYSETTNYQNLDVLVQKVILHHSVCSALWNKIFFKEIIKKNSIYFNTEISIGEDLLFLVDYITHIECWTEIPDTLYHYFIGQNTMQNYKVATEFDERWLSEWQALIQAQKSLRQATNGYIFQSNLFTMKKIRVANKLLGRIKKYKFNTRLKLEMKHFIQANLGLALKSSEFNIKQKLKLVLVSIL
ncbi:glycosyltransferase family 2 protein [Lactobacillus sp. CBA3605]|uniref:glycosyltransferase family 2 protein n=1 Tax=Lactobacillus sp. CBA3605 TaxID=2099788 RepID=UPI00131A43B0|nr:glycosyltransferase family 2 protein [Lactobacillus sp. CBA3605]